MSIAVPIEPVRPRGDGFPQQLFAVAIVVSLLAAALAGGLSLRLHQGFADLQTRDNQLHDYLDQVKLLDEVLTMSARMAAATGDGRYEQRYNKYEAELDALIKTTANALGLPEVRQFIRETDAANRKLVEMERMAFALASQGQRAEASALLN